MKHTPFWQDKVAVVTGASSGLGASIAEAFAAAGAKVVIAARGADALERTAARLGAEGRQVIAIPADVTRQDSVDALVARTVERFGRIDAWINNAGKSMRRAVLETTAEDFQQLLDLNLLSVVRCTRAAAAHLISRRGHLVNISSLAGKSTTRYMGAYPASKFAVTAYTQQLRLELSPQGLHVLLVCPGPVARAEPRSSEEEQARAAELARLPPSAHKPGAGVKTKLIPPEWLAAAIVRGCEQRRAELIVPPAARWLFALQQLSPRLADWIVERTT